MFARWQTFLYGAVMPWPTPLSASTVEIMLPMPIWALSSSIALRLISPAPGRFSIARPGMAFSQSDLNAPPIGIQEPPVGPVK